MIYWSVWNVLLLFVFTFCGTEIEAGTFDNCDQVININAGLTNLTSQNYPNIPDTSCRYQVIAPLDYKIVANCTVKLPNNCSMESIYLDRDGNLQLNNSEQFCDNDQFVRTSLFRRLTLAYVSYTGFFSGRFQCQLLAQPQPCDCGWSVNTKIANGQEAGVNEYPSMVALINKNTNTLFCGASIITHRHLISTAYCTYGRIPLSIVAVVGEHNITSDSDSPYTAVYDILQTMNHFGYVPNTMENDISILVTVKNMEWSRGVGPICLPPLADVLNTFADDFVDIAGWGETGYFTRSSTTLQKIVVKVMDNSICQKVDLGFETIYSTQLCTYDYSGTGRGTCNTDAGDPVIYRSARQIIVGIVSSSQFCGRISIPVDVNTRITSYLSWIYQQTGFTTCMVPSDVQPIVTPSPSLLIDLLDPIVNLVDLIL